MALPHVAVEDLHRPSATAAKEARDLLTAGQKVRAVYAVHRNCLLLRVQT